MYTDVPRGNLEVSMRGVGQVDAIGGGRDGHAKGNEGEKIGVERGNGGLDGAKLLKGKGEKSTPSFLGV
jgi:hypothetical protein